MSVVIYHNPRCSKSRATLDILKDRGINPSVIEYLSDTPDGSELKKIVDLLGGDARTILRDQEPEYVQAGLTVSSNNEQIIAAMLNYPKLIERPIVVVDGKKAVIGRPPENVLSILLD